MQKVYGWLIFRMKVEFFRDENNRIWFYFAHDIWVKPVAKGTHFKQPKVLADIQKEKLEEADDKKERKVEDKELENILMRTRVERGPN